MQSGRRPAAALVSAASEPGDIVRAGLLGAGRDLADVAAAFAAEPLGDVFLANGAELVAHGAGARAGVRRLLVWCAKPVLISLKEFKLQAVV
jgi:hypothetical protein